MATAARHVFAADKPPSSVYEIIHDGMVNGSEALTDSVDEATVGRAMDALILAMSGQDDIGRAWQTVLTGITTSSTVAVKLNLYSKGPQFATVKALVQGLTSMFGGTFPASQIALFDNGLEGNPRRVDEYYRAFDLQSLGVTHEPDAYGDAQIRVVDTSLYVSRTLNNADYAICCAAPRVHSWAPSGAGMFTGMIKNMMGAVSAHRDRYGGVRVFHGGANGTGQRPYVDLFRRYMRAKIHLYVADHILLARSENRRYPGFEKIGNRLIVGTDPCAVDSRSVDILKEHYTAPTKLVPEALAAAGIGTTRYSVRRVDV